MGGPAQALPGRVSLSLQPSCDRTCCRLNPLETDTEISLVSRVFHGDIHGRRGLGRGRNGLPYEPDKVLDSPSKGSAVCGSHQNCPTVAEMAKTSYPCSIRHQVAFLGKVCPWARQFSIAEVHPKGVESWRLPADTWLTRPPLRRIRVVHLCGHHKTPISLPMIETNSRPLGKLPVPTPLQRQAR